jgi:hypothetical protein
MRMSYNKGRFTIEEMDVIQSMRGNGSTLEEISKKINRDPVSVDKWIESNIGKTDEQKDEIELKNELRETPYYRELQRQFDNSDIEIFEMHWQRLWKQFKNDVFHTEEMQILDLCKIEVLMNKIRRDSKSDERRRDELMRTLSDISATTPMDDGEVRERAERIANLNRQLDSISQATSMREREFKDYLKEKNNMLKTLKGTRDQRIKDIESNKDTWPGMLRKINSDPNFREEMKEMWSKIAIATEKKRIELTQPIEYEDGTVDSPLLRPEDFEKANEDK